MFHFSTQKLIESFHFSKKNAMKFCVLERDTECQWMYHQNSNIRHSLVGDKIVDHSDVIGASPVGAAPTTSSFST